MIICDQPNSYRNFEYSDFPYFENDIPNVSMLAAATMVNQLPVIDVAARKET